MKRWGWSTEGGCYVGNGAVGESVLGWGVHSRRPCREGLPRDGARYSHTGTLQGSHERECRDYWDFSLGVVFMASCPTRTLECLEGRFYLVVHSDVQISAE